MDCRLKRVKQTMRCRFAFDSVRGHNNNISPEILDAVRHHHEYLDGSGYPDKLCAESISDVVRILTVSDIFSALIEDRRYKPPIAA
jgi:HD-GYP domain-containing protein (c-di-GMP phosphodiesterase class II)